MRMFRFSFLVALVALAALVFGSALAGAEVLAPKALLGKKLYFDRNLSSPSGQACADCHLATAGYADPDQQYPVSEGVISGLFGGRNAPSAAYAAFSPKFYYDTVEGLYIGGQFWDGRAATLADQAKGPFLNPVEMHNASKDEVIESVRNSAYAPLFLAVFGQGALDYGNEEQAYDQVAEAIGVYESSGELNKFNSKFDKVMAGKACFTPYEGWGYALFNGKAGCAACHPSTSADGVTPALFTDFTYDNLGLGQNPEVVALTGNSNVDLGLGGIVNDPNEYGKFKVPCLRNIAKTGPYGHNGMFKSLKDIVDFYNERDVTPDRWPAAEVPETVNHAELGNLGLTKDEVHALVAFLKMLTDQ